MKGFLKNPEFKSAAIKMAVLQGIFVIITFFFINNEIVSLNNKIIDQNTALIGHIVSEYPQMEDDIVGYVTRGANKEEIAKGRQVLEAYGYDHNMPISSQTMFKNSYMAILIKTVSLLLLYFIPLYLLLLFEYRKLYSKVNRISLASERVVEGDFSVIIPENYEGEFAKLSHSFNIMAERLKLNLEDLKEDKLFLKNIISDISHQLKTPLASLIMYNDNLLQDKNMSEKIRMEFLNRSKEQLDRMEWLVINLLKMARLEVDAINFYYEKMELKKAVQKSISALKSLWEEKGQTINISRESDACINGDEEWIGEALINIIKNCIEHTGNGGKIVIELSETPLFSRIVIKDNGEGIEEKDLPHIFERFYKGSNSVKTESIGIGLSLSKLIIEKQGGSIAANSIRGAGTEFTITFLKGVI